MTTLRDPETFENLAVILKTNFRACKSLGHSYFIQLASIYLDMLNVYKVSFRYFWSLYFISKLKVLSESISTAVLQASNDSVTKQPLIRAMKTVKKEILNVISLWVSRTTDVELVANNFVDPLLDAVLIDYRGNVL